MAAAAGIGLASAGTGFGIDQVTAAQDSTGVDKPLGWTPVNTDDIRKKARDNYYKGMHCAEGVAHTLIQAQREKGDNAWDQVPSTAVWWGAGGGAKNGALCGTITGASTVASLAFGRSGTTMKVVNEIHQRYQQTQFPQYDPPEDTEDGMAVDLPANRSKSPLCHVSVTKWCKTSGYAWSSPERAERCSRVAADMAGIAAELLNAQAQGNWDEVSGEVPELDSLNPENGCVKCHAAGNDFEDGGFVQTKMSCPECHGMAPHMPDDLKVGTGDSPGTFPP
jgi:hypothetical protein